MLWGIDLGKRRIAVACPEAMALVEVEVDISWPRWRQLQVLGEWIRLLPIAVHDTVMIESPIQGKSRNVQVGLAIAGTVGAVQSNLAAPSTLVAPSSWKAYVVGYGSADKSEVAAWLRESSPTLALACSSQDLIDACCIAYSGSSLA